MKTTIDLSDPLFKRAKALARRERRTFRDVVEQALRDLLARRRGPARFALRDASWGEGGTRTEVDLGDWDRIREAVYQGRGG